MDHRAPYAFGADAMLSDGAYYSNAAKDYDGNWYDAVILGNQVWMAQNLRTTHFADGTAITEGVTSSSSVPYYKNLYPSGQSTPFDRVKYGLHYNWAAVMNGASPSDTVPSGVQGIAPTGWHVPSKAEVELMIAYLNTQNRYHTGEADENNGHLAKTLAATYGWASNNVAKAPGYNPDKNNNIGFNLPPAGLGLGYIYASSHQLYAQVYTCTERIAGNAHILSISNDVNNGYGVFVFASSCDSTWMAPVRCICDLSPVEFRKWYISQYGNMQHVVGGTINDATLTIKRNGTTIDTFTANASADKEINILVPTSAADVNAMPSSTKYASYISLDVNSTTYVVTAQLKDQDGNNLGSAATIDLPLESVVVNGSYNSSTKKVVLTLENGSNIEFSVADLVAGLQSEITAQNPLSADLVVDGITNKVFTLTMKNKLDGIESGAQKNVQSDWNQTNQNADDFIKNKPDIPEDKVFVCTFNGTTTNKTPEEIKNAHQNNKTVICCYSNREFQLDYAIYNETNSKYYVRFYCLCNADVYPAIHYLSYNGTSWSSAQYDIQKKLVGSGTGQNIKTVNGNNLVGSGDIELGKGLITGTATSLSGLNAQVTLNESGADLEHGVFLMISFSVDMPANGNINVANTVILQSNIMWKNSRLPANAIKSGDTCLLYYQYWGGTNMTFLLFNTGWCPTLMDNDIMYSRKLMDDEIY